MDTVTVLLATYNGEKYLTEQLNSLIQQQGVTIRILARDDGSTDGTLDILSEFAQQSDMFSWYTGAHLGAALSFMDLMKNAKPCAYYAFCDQDDVWAPDKLARAIEHFKSADAAEPAMYSSSLTLVDEQLRFITNEQVKEFYTFGQALVRNNASGCTMVFNEKLLNILNSFTPETLSMHDHWVYLVCLLHDGKTFADKESHIQYRQHGANTVGGRRDIITVCKRRMKQFSSHEQVRKLTAVQLYKGFAGAMDEDKRALLEKIASYDKSVKSRFALIAEPRIRFPELTKNIVTWAAILLNVF